MRTGGERTMLFQMILTLRIDVRKSLAWKGLRLDILRQATKENRQAEREWSRR